MIRYWSALEAPDGFGDGGEMEMGRVQNKDKCE
jgi:hypothetical protein